MASCILSKLVDFQTKSAAKPCVTSCGTPSVLRNSSPISSETSATSQHELDSPMWTRTIGHFNDVADTFPGLVHLPRVAHSQLITRCKAHFPAFQLWKYEPRDSLLVQA